MQRKEGFTLIELLVMIAIIAILAGILFPVFAKAREQARKSACQSNLKQIGQAFQSYLQDYDETFPNTGDPFLWMGRRWRWPLKGYLAFGGQFTGDPLKAEGQGVHILICPSDDTALHQWDQTSYAYSAAFYHDPEQIAEMTTPKHLYSPDLVAQLPPVSQPLGGVRYPSEKGLVGEWLSNHDPIPNDGGFWDWRGKRNFLFVDGHIRFLRADQMEKAVNGFPDINVTVGGIGGRDVKR